MTRIDDEDKLLRSVALQNANTILVARQRAERDLLEAKEALETYPGPRLSPWLLRVALAAAQEKDFPAAKEALGPMHEEELSPIEMSWLRYLQGLVAEADGDFEKAILNVRQGLEIVEEIRGELIGSEVRYAYFSTVQNYYELLIDLFILQFEKTKDKITTSKILVAGIILLNVCFIECKV